MFKSLLTVTAVLAVAAPAMASKARMASMQNAAHLIDTQSIFDNPAKAYLMGDFATFEMGATSTASVGANTPENIVTNGGSGLATTFYGENAEGGFVKSYGDSKIGLYLGRKSAFTSRVRTLLGFAGQENPVEIMYGFQAADIKWGVSVNYSKSDVKATSQKTQEAMGMRLGVAGSNWDAAATVGLGSKATGNNASPAGLTAANATSDYKGTTGAKIGGGYWWDQTYIFGSYYMDGVEMTGLTGAGGFAGLTGAKLEQNQYEVGIIDTVKSDGLNFFYGVSYIGFTSKVSNETPAVNANLEAQFGQEQSQLPFVVGVEADAASWLTLRASAKQNVILGSSKTNGAAGADAGTVANNTTVAVGAGMKFNKFVLDTTLAAGSVPSVAGTGNVNANDLFANASLSYMF